MQSGPSPDETTHQPFDHDAPGAAAVRRKALVGSLMGSSIEWFDYFLYATMSALVFNKLFFPNLSPALGQMAAFTTLALAFFIRPLGGVIFSHIGDRIGRKKTLFWTLVLMGGATVGIGLLPTADQVGMLAPALLLLLRLVQGIGLGGEWGGAMLLAYEYAPRGKRGFYGAVPQTGITIGLLLSTVVIALVSQLPDDTFLAWGWRIPFIGSILLVVLGLWIRSTIGETPDFAQTKDRGEVAKVPLLEVLRTQPGAVLTAIGLKVAETGPFYIFSTYVVAYATSVVKMNRTSVLNTITWAMLVTTVMILVMGRLADRYGRRPVYLTGLVLMALVSAPYFLLVNTGSIWLLVLAGTLALGVAWAPTTATLGTLSSEIFSPHVRYTGVSLGYQIGAALAGGTAPLIATALYQRFQSWVPIALYVVLCCLVSLVALVLSRKAATYTHEEPAS